MNYIIHFDWIRYLVTNYDGNPDTQWWNSRKNEAAYIDFTKPEATQWYIERLKNLQKEAGIDSLKFDAGESSWIPSVNYFNFLNFDNRT